MFYQLENPIQYTLLVISWKKWMFLPLKYIKSDDLIKNKE